MLSLKDSIVCLRVMETLSTGLFSPKFTRFNYRLLIVFETGRSQFRCRRRLSRHLQALSDYMWQQHTFSFWQSCLEEGTINPCLLWIKERVAAESSAIIIQIVILALRRDAFNKLCDIRSNSAVRDVGDDRGCVDTPLVLSREITGGMSVASCAL